MIDPHTLWAAAQLVPGEGIADGVARIAELTTPDCRTCARCYPTKVRFVHGCDSIVVCVNANQYQPAAPVQLWGMT